MVFGLFRSKPKRLPNITVYYLSSLDEQGNCRTSPLGVVPRLTDEQERLVQQRHNPLGKGYLDDTLNGVSAILSWTGQDVDAVNFLSIEDARLAFPDLLEFPPEDLQELDPVFRHFPR